ncbi:hypothetical protein CVE27_13120 [Pseudomonas syringae pv. actinidiae]|nr:hypothetical protein [Pseudomonas syringae pv. actinidiae]
MDHETLQETPGGRGALVLEKTGRGASRTACDAERRTIIIIADECGSGLVREKAGIIAENASYEIPSS